MFNYFKIAIPFALFILIIAILWRGLSLHPAEIPSPLINQSTPEFNLPSLFNDTDTLSNKELIGKVSIISVWASWCEACAEENIFLLSLAKDKSIQLIGIDYKDDSEVAKKWLTENGNPYRKIGIDLHGKTAIDLGVYGTPETFIIDKNGIIRYKQIGIITPEVWESDIKPIINNLKDEIR